MTHFQCHDDRKSQYRKTMIGGASRPHWKRGSGRNEDEIQAPGVTIGFA